MYIAWKLRFRFKHVKMKQVKCKHNNFQCHCVSKYGVISGPYFPVFSPNTVKYGPEITPYLDTFHAVCFTSNKTQRTLRWLSFKNIKVQFPKSNISLFMLNKTPTKLQPSVTSQGLPPSLQTDAWILLGRVHALCPVAYKK